MSKWICLRDEKPKVKGCYLTAIPSIYRRGEWVFYVSPWNGEHFVSSGGYPFLQDADEIFWQEIDAPAVKVGSYAFEGYDGWSRRSK